ncbi:RNA-binding domain-containing protein [Linderina pennispora]|uniref:RNA-binding domain-containing protein n=1 Tax=Linderina pennispora TaxID=61395 RepID=A0A1Y1VR12_9FUNG|nr:RNA-binding domain-containing protein [Linderina pennispora]ORX63709.1 RNA-binding domain-containing protein [Linderina pennispora]
MVRTRTALAPRFISELAAKACVDLDAQAASLGLLSAALRQRRIRARHRCTHASTRSTLTWPCFTAALAPILDNVPTRSLWVGNVDPGLNTQDLIAIFGKYGRVESLRLLPDKECAFVNFLRVEDAIRAKDDMHNGTRIGNNTVRVGFGKGESYATGDAQAMQPTRALWIGNIAQATTPDSLSTTFQAYGTHRIGACPEATRTADSSTSSGSRMPCVPSRR